MIIDKCPSCGNGFGYCDKCFENIIDDENDDVLYDYSRLSDIMLKKSCHDSCVYCVLISTIACKEVIKYTTIGFGG